MREMPLDIIARIHTDFPQKFGIPRQGGLIKGLKGKVVFEPEYRNPDAIRGIEDFSHLWLLWGFNKTIRQGWSATVAPPRLGGRVRMGVFATRSSYRPNSIGLSSVQLEKIELDERIGPVLTVSGIDMLDGTPIYDIKPYLPYADCHPEAKGGFGEIVKEHKLQVHFPEELQKLVEAEKRQNIIDILEQDPRAVFIHDEDRIWGMSYGGYNIKFKVVGLELTVCEVTQ